MQETKWNSFDLDYIGRVLPSFFDRNCVTLNALGSAGGLLIAWKRNFVLINSWVTKHTCSALLMQVTSGTRFLVTNVYGPSTDPNKKLEFLQELLNLKSLVKDPWLLMGDFNVVRWMNDRSGALEEFCLMDRFNEIVDLLQLMEVPLQNRNYTWSSKRPEPSFSKLDRLFLSTEWSSRFPSITLHALEMAVSDHVPLILCCKQLQTSPKPLRLEKAWFRYPFLREVVHQTWSRANNDMVSFQRRCDTMHRELRKWHLQNFGELNDQLSFSKRAVLFFDKIEEHRRLDQREFLLRIKLKERIFELANFEEMKWYQRSRCRWVQYGDRNASFFHNFASARARRNMVLQIEHEGQTITDEELIKDVFFGGNESHFRLRFAGIGL